MTAITFEMKCASYLLIYKWSRGDWRVMIKGYECRNSVCVVVSVGEVVPRVERLWSTGLSRG